MTIAPNCIREKQILVNFRYSDFIVHHDSFQWASERGKDYLKKDYLFLLTELLAMILRVLNSINEILRPLTWFTFTGDWYYIMQISCQHKLISKGIKQRREKL